MDKLSVFLGPASETPAPAPAPVPAATSEREGSPEAAGIVRISAPQGESRPITVAHETAAD